MDEKRIRIIDIGTQIMMIGITSIILWIYTVYVGYRPGGMNTVGSWYMSWNKALTLGIVGIVLLFLTRNIFLSITSGAFATIMWTFVLARANQGFGTPFKIVEWERGWLGFGLLMFVLVAYWGRKKNNNKYFNRILIVSFVLFLITYLGYAFFPYVVAPNWMRVYGGGKFYPSELPELAYDILMRSSGYLFFSLGIIKLLSILPKVLNTKRRLKDSRSSVTMTGFHKMYHGLLKKGVPPKEAYRRTKQHFK